MRRTTLFALLVGIAIGFALSLARRDLVYERRTVALGVGPGRIPFSELTTATTRDGCRIVRVGNEILYQLERPRLRLPSSEIPRATTKPTEVPKPVGR